MEDKFIWPIHYNKPKIMQARVAQKWCCRFELGGSPERIGAILVTNFTGIYFRHPIICPYCSVDGWQRQQKQCGQVGPELGSVCCGVGAGEHGGPSGCPVLPGVRWVSMRRVPPGHALVPGQLPAEYSQLHRVPEWFRVQPVQQRISTGCPHKGVHAGR